MTLIDGLEKVIGKERTEKLANTAIYSFCADAIAINVFLLAYALNERYVAGMSWAETGKARIAAAIGNTSPADHMECTEIIL